MKSEPQSRAVAVGSMIKHVDCEEKAVDGEENKDSHSDS